MTGHELIQVKDLKKYYHKGAIKALDGITVDIEKGDVAVVIGPSGGGKSTFLRSLNLLETPTSGSIIFDGEDITGKKVDLPLHRQKMGMVFQHFNLFPHKTILENLTLAPMKVKHISEAEAKAKAMALLERVGLADRAGAYPAQLSGGQKQRVAIARMLLQQAPIMIFDDSLSAVDAETDAKIRAALQTRLGRATVILISHRIGTLMQADQILVLENGRVSQKGTHAQLIAQPGIYQEIYNIQLRADDRAQLMEGGDC